MATNRPAPSQSIVLAALLRSDFESFVQKVFVTVNPGTTFIPNWHISAICHRLVPLIRGEPQRLLVNLPPRTLKSLIVSVALPAFRLGHDPTMRIIVASYSDDLSRRIARDFRRVVESPWYQRLFPRMRIDSKKNTESEVATTLGGSRFATSVGGTLTGRGGDLIIIDDPIKPFEAASEAERQRVNEWFDSTVISRLDNPSKGSILLVMQRVHEADLTGHLLEKGGWSHLAFPAVAVAAEAIPLGRNRVHHRQLGDVLEPLRYPREVLEQLREHLGSSLYEAQYQQNPIPAGGTIIKAVWFRYEACGSGLGPFDQIVQSWDVASKTSVSNDYSVCTTWGAKSRTYYLLDVIRRRLEFPELLSLAKDTALAHQANRILIEDAGTGMALAQALRRDTNLNIIPIKPKLEKVVRVERSSAVFEAGRVVLPTDAAWLADYQRELLSFPGGRHDDQVDSTSQFVNWAEERSFAIPIAWPIIIRAPRPDPFANRY